MKVIDLLNRYVNSEEMPEYIIYDTKKYVGIVYDYKEIDDKGNIDEQSSWFENLDFYKLDEEVEIIEEDKKIEKLNYNTYDEFNIEGFTFDYEQKIQIVDKINEIIDYLEDKQC